MIKKFFRYLQRTVRNLVSDFRVARRVRAMKRKDPFIY
jgi:hypothetical protein